MSVLEHDASAEAGDSSEKLVADVEALARALAIDLRDEAESEHGNRHHDFVWQRQDNDGVHDGGNELPLSISTVQISCFELYVFAHFL